MSVPMPPHNDDWQTFWLGALVLACLLFLLGHMEARQDLFMRRQVEFVEAWESWARQGNGLSGVSPDYGERIQELWLREQVGEKFRRFETQLEELR